MAEPASEITAAVDVTLVVRGVLSPSGGSGRLLELLKEARFVPVASRLFLQELYRVLAYPRLLRSHRITRRQRERVIAQMYGRSLWVEPVGRLSLCRDPHDDYLIEMALLGGATYLVAEDNDLHHDPDIVQFLDRFGVRLLRLGEFLEALRSLEHA